MLSRRYSGAGNSFLLFDNRQKDLDFSPELIRELCSLPLHSDGIIFLEASALQDVKMRIFNADGGEAEMCGNGVRCLYRFMQDLGMVNDERISLETLGGVVEMWKDGDFVSVAMPDPSDIHWGLELEAPHAPLIAHFLNTGVPHLVIPVEDVKIFPLENCAKALATPCPLWPQSTNVNIFKTLSPQSIQLRTFERGVGETPACGTGATASALVFAQLQQAASPVEVLIASRDRVLIHFERQGDLFSQVILSGPAKYLQSLELESSV